MSRYILAALLISAALPQPAAAAAPCGARDNVLSELGETFGEAPVGIGLSSNGGLLELLTSADGGTWTMILTMPNGPTCLVAAGKDWQAHAMTAVNGPAI